MSENRGAGPQTLFVADAWRPALEKFGGVTHLTVVLYDLDGRPAGGPFGASPLFDAFAVQGFDPGTLRECAARCLAQWPERAPVVMTATDGVCVVGASLVLDGARVGAAVAGYALVDFARPAAIERLAREAGIPFRHLWSLARLQPPVPARRLVLHGELLQILGDTILRESYRTRQYEETAERLTAEMAAKDEFLAVLSHELRTPLAPILTWARILRIEEADPTRRLQAVESIERNTRQQIKLIDDLLDLNRVIRDKIPFDIEIHELGNLLRLTVDTTTGPAVAKDVALELVPSGVPLRVQGDAGRLQQILLNVLANAVKFTPAGGRIRAELSAEGDEAVVRISDTGEGITGDFLPHVFDLFGQQERGTRRQHGGLGIGLALVKRLVEVHGGRVEVESGGAGLGTNVTLRFPVVHAAPTSDGAGPEAQLDWPRLFEHMSVLIIEDTEDALEALRMLLQMFGARVVVARNGKEGLEAVDRDLPDLVLCDLRMPLMDGFEFVRALRQRDGTQPAVVAMTGLASEADHRRTRSAGFDAHLDKPFDSNELVQAVQAALAANHSS